MLSTPSIINISPRYSKNSRRLKFEDIWRGISIAAKMWSQIPLGGTVVAFVTNGFFFHLAPLFELIKRYKNAKIVLSFFGGNLDEDLVAMTASKRKRFLRRLGKMDSVIVETQFLKKKMMEFGLSDVICIPGYRNIDLDTPACARSDNIGTPRIVFMSHITQDKGVYLLLEALRRAATAGHPFICDLYGPIPHGQELKFDNAWRSVPGVLYCGVAQGNIPEILMGYDLLALPTSHRGEGHPGVIIEAMIAGIPVLSTRFRGIPELIEDGVNGVLVSPGNVEELYDALLALLKHPARLKSLGSAHKNRLENHDVALAVSKLDSIIKPWVT